MKFTFALLGLALSTLSAQAEVHQLHLWRITHVQCWSATKTPPPYNPGASAAISYTSENSGRKRIQIAGAGAMGLLPLTRAADDAREYFDWDGLKEDFNYSYSSPSVSRGISFSLNPLYKYQARMVWTESIYDSKSPYGAASKLLSGVDCVYELVRLN